MRWEPQVEPELDAIGAESPAAGNQWYSGEDLFTMENTLKPPIITELLASAGCTVIAGDPKFGKSTVAMEMVAAVTRGEQFLERFPVQKKAAPSIGWRTILRWSASNEITRSFAATLLCPILRRRSTSKD